MTTTLAQAHPMPAHSFRRAAVKGAITMVILTAAGVGLYQGAQVVARLGQPSDVTYVDQGQLQHKLAGVTHAPATKGGAFIPTVSIGTGDVQVDSHMVVVP